MTSKLHEDIGKKAANAFFRQLFFALIYAAITLLVIHLAGYPALHPLFVMIIGFGAVSFLAGLYGGLGQGVLLAKNVFLKYIEAIEEELK